MMQSLYSRFKEGGYALPVAFLLLLSYFTIVHNYWNPSALFWDENYHIASAQKYLHGVFYMEPHPPLGKLLIAAGEGLLNVNPLDDQFLTTDYATNPPSGFSFLGYRFFPVLLAWLTTPFLFWVFLLITRKKLWATLFTLFYVFDNALIVHNRSAMLESTMLFFSVLTILGFLILHERSKDAQSKITLVSILTGVAFGAALATKVFTLLFVLLIPFLLFSYRKDMKRFWHIALMGLLGCVVTYIGIWQIHFSIAERIEPMLPDAGYYQASDQYKAILAAGKNNSIFAIPYMMRDSQAFVGHYEAGVPKLDLCKADENGSPWFLWPFGARTINYRWETPDGNGYQYLYLMSNPVAWFMGLLAVVGAMAFLAGSVLFYSNIKLQRPYLLLTFVTLYGSYMAAISTIDRVMYMYHYFLPLMFAYILVALVFMEIKQFWKWDLTESRKTGILLAMMLAVFASFQFYRPLTYYVPIGKNAFERRNLVDLWELTCVGCTKESIFTEQVR